MINRRCALKLAAGAIVAPSVGSVGANVLASTAVRAQQEPGGSVPMFRGGPARTGVMPGPGPDSASGIAARWRFEAEAPISSSPAVVDGAVYVGGEDSRLYAVDAASGAERWRFATEDRIRSSPAFAAGVVYVGDIGGNLYAVDAASGAERWRFTSDSPIESSPAVVDGVVYVGSGYFKNGDVGYLFALDAASGAERWRFGTDGQFSSSPAVADGVVYAGSYYQIDTWNYTGNFYAVDAASGAERWRFAAVDGFEASPAIADGVVYAGSFDGNLYALDALSGAERWRFAAGAIGSSPAVAEGAVFVGSQDFQLYAVDAASGKERWRFATEDVISSSPAAVDGVIYVGGLDGNVYALDAADGAERWRFEVGGAEEGAGVYSSPAVVDGVVYVGSGAVSALSSIGYLYALGDPDPEARPTQAAQGNGQHSAAAFADALVATALAGEQLPGGFASPTRLDGTRGAGWVPSDAAAVGAIAVAVTSDPTHAATVAFAVYDSEDAARTAFANAPEILARGGWQQREAQGVGHDATCLVARSEGGAQAVCYVSRDDVVIATYSSSTTDPPDAVYGRASDMAVWASGVYDRTERPG